MTLFRSGGGVVGDSSLSRWKDFEGRNSKCKGLEGEGQQLRCCLEHPHYVWSAEVQISAAFPVQLLLMHVLQAAGDVTGAWILATLVRDPDCAWFWG